MLWRNVVNDPRLGLMVGTEELEADVITIFIGLRPGFEVLGPHATCVAGHPHLRLAEDT